MLLKAYLDTFNHGSGKGTEPGERAEQMFATKKADGFHGIFPGMFHLLIFCAEIFHKICRKLKVAKSHESRNFPKSKKSQSWESRLLLKVARVGRVD